MYLPNTLSIITTYRCSAACAHCCFKCNPERKETLSLVRIKEFIYQASQIPSIQLIVFTGGECFLLGEDLIESIRYATSLGIATRCVSNGSWATSSSTAIRWAKKIKVAGLTELNISIGDHHARYVPFETSLRAIYYCCEARIRTAVNLELFKGSRSLPLLKSIFRNWKEIYPHLSTHYGLWIPNDGETALNHAENFKRNLGQKKFRGCDNILTSLTINPDEKLLDCCGLHVNKIKEMVIGDLTKESIPEMLGRRNKFEDLLKLWIAVEGPEAVLQAASKYNSYIKLDKGTVHHCQTCMTIYSREDYRAAIEAACAEHMERIYGLYRVANRLQECILHIDTDLQPIAVNA